MPDTRGHILDAATELFARKGYDATSIRDIAERASVAPSLLNHHFGNKTALLVSVFQRVSAWSKEQRRIRSLAIADASLDDPYWPVELSARKTVIWVAISTRVTVRFRPDPVLGRDRTVFPVSEIGTADGKKI